MFWQIWLRLYACSHLVCGMFDSFQRRDRLELMACIAVTISMTNYWVEDVIYSGCCVWIICAAMREWCIWQIINQGCHDRGCIWYFNSSNFQARDMFLSSFFVGAIEWRAELKVIFHSSYIIFLLHPRSLTSSFSYILALLRIQNLYILVLLYVRSLTSSPLRTPSNFCPLTPLKSSILSTGKVGVKSLN